MATRIQVCFTDKEELERARKLIESDPLYEGNLSDYFHRLLSRRADELGTTWQRQGERGGYRYPEDAIPTPSNGKHGGYRPRKPKIDTPHS